MHHIGNAATCGIHYFFTFGNHLESVHPGIVAAHRDHADVLTTAGVAVHSGRFKRRRVRCNLCRGKSFRHEEKETDVAIAATLIELAVTGACDVVVLVSGDTDLIPAIRTARRLASGIQLWIAFPFGHRNRELTQVADGTFKLAYQQYVQHQLPATVTLPNGRVVKKPGLW